MTCHRNLVWCVLCALALPLAPGASAQEYISAPEAALITAGSVAVGVGGELLRQVDSGRTPLFSGPILFDRVVERWVAGNPPPPGQTNFLDSDLGSAVTPVAVSAVLFLANLTWPTGEPWRDATQDLFLSGMGLLANKGLNDAVKGRVARPRPYTRLEAGAGVKRPRSNYTYDHNSFYSGHASSSFFITTYANRRLRAIMRNGMSSSRYDSWKWVPPVVLYGWAGFVGLSRIHAGMHYATDVLVGAVAGVLVAQLYYAFGNPATADPGANPPTLVTVRFSF
jgi:membrane-associated phospholipid phosphatase